MPKLEIDVTDEQLHDLFTTAVESGIGYWSRCRAYDPNGGTAEILEVESDDTPTPEHRIDRAVLLQGLQRLLDGTVTFGGKPWKHNTGAARVAAFVSGEYDADDADVVVQAGLFGDIRYG